MLKVKPSLGLSQAFFPRPPQGCLLQQAPGVQSNSRWAPAGTHAARGGMQPLSLSLCQALGYCFVHGTMSIEHDPSCCLFIFYTRHY